MSVDKYQGFTFYDWDEGTRPELRINAQEAVLHIGPHQVVEISGGSRSDLKSQLEGYAEIFSEVAREL